MADVTKPSTAEGGGWTLSSQDGTSYSLKYETTSPAQDVGPDEVLVDLYAASLNYRDLVVANWIANPNPQPMPGTVVPGSDGAGRIVATGSRVSSVAPDLQPGTDVLTHMIPHVADDQLPDLADVASGLGQGTPGTLRRRGVFHHGAVVPMPRNLGHAQAATLGCSGLTAWNALMGLPGRRVRSGDWVLVQGTGGVSVAALQLAVAAGAQVIATTSSEAKAERLRSLGAAHVLNYKTTPDWGQQAKALTPGSRGLDIVVDVGGAKTLPESLNAVRRDGLLVITGFVGGIEGQVTDMMSAIWRICVVRGIILGTRDMMREMVQFIEENQVHLAVDDVEFKLDDTTKAYERLKKQEHFAKVIIKIR